MIGADVVGMSTVPEVIVAVHAGLKVVGFSIVTDMCLPDCARAGRRAERSSPPPTPRSRSCEARDGRAGGTGARDVWLPHSTALAHKGNLICGKLDGVPVVVMQGRCHLYEGYDVERATLAVRVMHALGAKTLIVSNAAGGVNPQFVAGDVMLIEDHIQLMFLQGLASFLPGQTDRMPRVSARLYDPELIERGLQIAREQGFACQRGVYVAVTGPSYETRAEYRMFRKMGDCVGMSTVPEVLVAAECGMRVFGISTITNIARPDSPAPDEIDAEHVVQVAQFVQPKVRALVRGLLSSLR
jgi:purine-nucleoside phosphorylase